MCKKCNSRINGMSSGFEQTMMKVAGAIIGGAVGKVLNKVTDKVDFLRENPEVTSIAKGGIGFLGAMQDNALISGAGLGMAGVAGAELSASFITGTPDMPVGWSRNATQRRQHMVLGTGNASRYQMPHRQTAKQAVKVNLY